MFTWNKMKIRARIPFHNWNKWSENSENWKILIQRMKDNWFRSLRRLNGLSRMTDENGKASWKNICNSILEHHVGLVFCFRKTNYLKVVNLCQWISFAGLILCTNGYSSLQIFNVHRSLPSQLRIGKS